ncbi:phosphatidate cytidylyltransferase [Pseudanabaenaceae cyanobacterium LEGE 13415]|nr:phosphatidate cytidylyltransferase [Pseudanabaenaceae cyanobacterium LEGE 13415]
MISEWIHSLFGQCAIVLLWLSIVGLCAEIVNRVTGNNELVRKVVHIGTGNVILIAWWLNTPMWLGVGASILFSAIALLSYYVPILPNINSIGRKSFGTFFYAVSIGVLVGWFWSISQPQFAAIGILVMTWGDGFAALIGQRFGKHPYRLWDMKKSWEGSGSMALISFTVCALILLFTIGNVWQIWLISIVIGLIAATLEAFSKFGIDNLTVPISSAAIAFFLTQTLIP